MCLLRYVPLANMRNMWRLLLLSTVRSIRNVSLYDFIHTYTYIFTRLVIPKRFAVFYRSFWFDSGSTGANAQWGSQPKQHATWSQWNWTCFFWYPQRLLPIEGANDLFYQPPPSLPTSKLYSIRPYFPKDEVRCVFFLVMPEFMCFVLKHQQLLSINNVIT